MDTLLERSALDHQLSSLPIFAIVYTSLLLPFRNFVQSFIKEFQTSMARTKQATPLRREPSSEYTSKADGYGTPSRSARNLDRDNKSVFATKEDANGDVVRPIIPETKKDAGIIQLLFAAGGIYGSLYVHQPITED